MHKQGIPQSDYTIVQGYFSNIPLLDLKNKAALVILDCDLWESTMDALRFIKPYLQSGTVILAGEYFNYRADFTRGMAGAINNCFKSELVSWRPYGDSGMSFIYKG